MSVIYESQRRAKRLYKLRHREQINAQRKEYRATKRAAQMGDRKCACCTKLLQFDAKWSIKYCGTCRYRNQRDLRALEPLNKERNQRQIVYARSTTSWRVAKQGTHTN